MKRRNTKPSTKISHAIKALKADLEIARTGTPVENRLLDPWNLLESIQPVIFRSAQEFRRDYEDPVSGGESNGTVRRCRQRRQAAKSNHTAVSPLTTGKQSPERSPPHESHLRHGSLMNGPDDARRA